MSVELELVRDYMAHEEDRASDLAIARSILEDVIASEIDTPRTAPRARRLRWALRLSVGAAAAIAACVVLILQIVPTAKISTPVAAAAQLSHLADVVQPAVPLQAGQWSTYQMQGVVDASVNSLGETPTPDAKSSMPLSYQVWSNSTGSACTSQQFGIASFASPANAQAWHAIGLIDTPTNQPATGCLGGLEATWASGSGPEVIDVSNLTHDPTALAEQLQSGTTGIQSIDQTAVGNAPHVAGFIRLTILLVGPTIGQWSGFGQEMLRTMSLLPGVIGLGDMTAHSGKSGLAFTVGEQVTLNPQTGAVEYRWKGPTLILDAKTGALREARSFSLPLLQSAAQDFVGSQDAPVYTQGVSYGVTAEWIDPVGNPTVVTQDALPGWIASFHIIEAVTLPNTPDSDLDPVINPFLGNGNMDALDRGVPTPDVNTHDITIIGTQAEVATVVAALINSGHFSSVTVKM
jgi:hypothetical protein